MKLPCSPAVNLGCRNLISQSVTPIDQTAESGHTSISRSAGEDTKRHSKHAKGQPGDAAA